MCTLLSRRPREPLSTASLKSSTVLSHAPERSAYGVALLPSFGLVGREADINGDFLLDLWSVNLRVNFVCSSSSSLRAVVS